MRLGILAGALIVAAIARVAIRPPAPSVAHVPTAVAATSPSERGHEVYLRYGCAQCHGGDAKGGFANPNAETDGKVPGLVFVKEGYTPQELRRKVLDGAPVIGKADPRGLTPPYRMPGWRGQMTDQEVTDLVEYLLSLYPKSAEDKWR